MAYTVICRNTNKITLEEYADWIETHVDMRDEQSVLESAPMLRALANNRDILVEKFNHDLMNFQSKGPSPYSQSSFVLYSRSRNTEHFYVRGNIWAVPQKGQHFSEKEERLFSYNLGHSHNFDFMTANWFGPGYSTEIHEFDYHALEGYIGEKVEMKLLEKVDFTDEKVMYYRRYKDIHVQLPPPSLSISLNLMASIPEYMKQDQFHFDMNSRTISGYPATMITSRQISVLEMARFIHDERTVDLLDSLLRRHASPRLRAASLDVLLDVCPDDRDEFLKVASTQQDYLMREAVARHADQLEFAA